MMTASREYLENLCKVNIINLNKATFFMTVNVNRSLTIYMPIMQAHTCRGHVW